MLLSVFINSKKTNRDFGHQKCQKVKEKERSGGSGALLSQKEKLKTDVFWKWTNKGRCPHHSFSIR